jgi:hypothetical protein
MKSISANLAGLLALTSTTQGAIGLSTPSASATEVINAVSTLIGSVAGLVWIIYLHRNRQPADTKTPPGPPSPPIASLLLAGLLAGLLACSATGCRATPERRLVIARQTYTAALTAAADLRTAGRLDDGQYREIESARLAAAGAIALLELDAAAQQSPDPSTLQRLENSVQVIAATVREIYARNN